HPGVYQEGGICLRNHRRAEPPRDIEPAGLVGAVGRRNRTSPWHGAAGRLEAPARTARGRLRGVDGGCTASPVPAETGTTPGGGCLAHAIPSVLVRAPGRARASSRPHGSEEINEKEEKETKMTTVREQYAPGPASAEVHKDGEKWTLVLVRELRHSPEKVW